MVAKWLRGTVCHPAGWLPGPAAEIVAEEHVGGELLVDQRGFTAREGLCLGGRVHFDGHADPHPSKVFRHASWGVAPVGAEGTELVRVYGPVCSPLPRTPQASDTLGLCAVYQIITAPVHVVGECLNASKTANAPQAVQLSPTKLYAGLYRGFRSLDRSNIESASWTKGHVLGTVPLDKVPAEQRRVAFGKPRCR